ncbi:hypothetical protein A2765_01455 [Candidatus Kaiserbacteria bacterium RIFCSPHIGHO2_01_FULL_56_24]|uniref:DUF1190 domain-containing protein n=1 Tax=Candidatus Kaiserbacteria bacterium RIFCSPHIGHO2_01_FULL_56_24 TaxID=1798487 RepID=A0A1F6DH69_9BACT|nr:MAG: hypothetical protein A2765_01455 [Candidatus Kaiserbacteria bacterium RIFCSPHIGHO2_01_FULL_56_24]
MKERRSKEVKLVLLTASVASMLAACDPVPTSFDSQTGCERYNGAGNCAAPQAVLMTDANRPSYEKKDECQQDFGEEKCVEEKRGSGSVYRPFFHPYQTYFYPHATPGYAGYYGGSPTARFDASKTPAATKFAPRTNIVSPHGTISRGGFGSIGASRGGGMS